MTEDNRIPEIREALSELDQWEHDSAHRVVERIRAILDSAPPEPGPGYVGRHPKDPNPNDPGFCYCGLGLEAWVHTDTTHYVEVPLGRGNDRLSDPGTGEA